MKDKAALGFAVAGYNAWQYLFSFCILAHALAISMVFLATVLAIRKECWLLPMSVTLLAFTVHNSALVMTIVILVIYIFNWTNTRVNLLMVLLLLVIAGIIINNLEFIFKGVITNVDGFEQYEMYDQSHNSGSGLFNYVLFTYIFVILILPAVISGMPMHEKRSIVMYFLFSLISAIMGYILGTARLNQYSLSFYSAAIPWYIFQIRSGQVKLKYILPIKEQELLWALYLIFATYAVLTTASNPLSSNELSSYELFNPFAWGGY